MKEKEVYWPHAPRHAITERGGYMVTCGTYNKARILNTPEKKTLLQDMLFEQAHRFGWDLQAWAIMVNHYHFVALSPTDAKTLRPMITAIHKWSALQLNKLDHAEGRKVWHNYWDSHVTHQTSWLARLHYVHQNPVHHGVVNNASNYRWCSQAWLKRTASRAYVNTLDLFKTDHINVHDDFFN